MRFLSHSSTKTTYNYDATTCLLGILCSYFLLMESSAAEHGTGRPPNWIRFDEISMTSPIGGYSTSDGQHKPSLGSAEISNGRSHLVKEEQSELENTERDMITSLPLKEVIADPSTLGQAPVMEASQEFYGRSPHGIQTHGGTNLVNGKIVATIYPENTMYSWIVPPRYNPCAIPSVLTSECFSVPTEDFITAMELITNDYRFRSFSSLYSRLVAFWMALSMIILLAVLFSNSEGGVLVMMFSLFWCVMLFAGIIACAVIRKQIRVGLRHCVQSANEVLIKNNIMAGVEDKGQLSCHKVVIHIMWFRLEDCLPDIERLIRVEASGGAVVFGGEAHTAPAKEMTKKEIEEKARQLVLKYSQDYVKSSARYRIIFPSRPSLGVSEFNPKHCPKQLCLCQFIDKNHFNRSPRKWYSHLV